MSQALEAHRNELLDAADLLRSRRTIHDFLEDEPPREAVLRALDLARWAPNHHVTQPWRFYLIGEQTREAICRLNERLVTEAKGPEAGREKYERWRRIPGWLLVTCENSDDPVRAREDFAATCCAVHNFSLYLWSQGIGVKWTTGAVTRTEAFYDLVWVDDAAESVVGLFWYGYAAEVPLTARKPVDEVLVTLP